MGFFYISIFSLIFIAVIYAVVLWLFHFIWVRIYKRKFSGPVVWSVVALVLVAPWFEEIWIAWNFGQLCKKDAGLSIYKTVSVEGFYDATMPSGYEITKAGGFRFVEHPAEDGKGVERVELADATMRQRALEWYERTNPGKERPSNRAIVYPLNETQAVVVFPNGVDAWRVTKLAAPTARYHYRRLLSHTSVGYRLNAFEWVVEDMEAKSVMAREKAYARQPYWFYIGLDRPTMFCPPFGNFGEKLTGGLYRLVLKPIRK